ncbi:MAG: dihydroorotate dehydrogenase electron transfer subunit [Muribaculum sp.]|nr:dihydroorotate dehydrogenase electron transfer subunit [Muribaculum sp.]
MSKFTIAENTQVARRTWKMRLRGDTTDLHSPGQFVNVSVPGKYLRRPISVADRIYGAEGEITLLYDVVGEGTSLMSEMKEGSAIDLLSNLGNGFNVGAECHHPILMGGGIGVAPLLWLAKALTAVGKHPLAALGFNTKSDIILKPEFDRLGIECHVATADGSEGFRGFVTNLYDDIVQQRQAHGLSLPDYFYACGPTPMLKAVCSQIDLPGEVSIDERMGCGFGACMCCTIKTTEGPRRACKDGPVFKKEVLIWE